MFGDGVKITGVQHVGIPVRSMERSLAWYEDVFGLVPEFVVESDSAETAAAVQLPGAHVTAAFLNVGNTYIELLEYHNPVGEDFSLRNCDVGAIHVAIEVDSIDTAYSRLSARGAEFSAPPSTIQEGDLAGWTFAYFRDPDRIQFELFQRPS
jgi:catechol 2,3-dioxygenase-like lactoylglutathione lyase family enzyme